MGICSPSLSRGDSCSVVAVSLSFLDIFRAQTEVDIQDLSDIT